MTSDDHVSVNDVEEQLNVIEKALSDISPGDNFARAILENQRTMLVQSTSGGGGVSALALNGVSDLSEGVVGTAMETFNENAYGDVLFSLSGTDRIMQARAGEDIIEGDSVYVVGENDVVETVENQGATEGNRRSQLASEEITVASDSYKEVSWDFSASVLSVIIDTESVEVRIVDPDEDDEGDDITIKPSDGKLTLSGSNGVAVNRFWIRLKDGTSADQEVRYIAVE